MYRYLLFYYDHYYPHGGMNDCVLKTNNFVDIEQYIHDNYEDDYLMGTISCYDTIEDKVYIAEMILYANEYYLPKHKFAGWKEN